MTDRVGQQLGNYRLIKRLGEGGFAEVYQGEHLYLKTQAAIKVLHTRLAEDDREGFVSEAQTIARLKHPHIVRVLDFGMEGNTPFLVMDFAPNGTLRQRHRKGTRLAPALILPYIKQVAEALHYAHEQKLVHRDVKPENMLIGERGEVLLSDFGIATVAQSSRYQGTQEVAGTVAYMAPEQVQGRPRPASDQYALGIVVYEWLAGERPFHGSFTEIATQHVLMPPPPLREKRLDLSPAIEQAVLIALSKDPKERFASVQAFANAFEAASQSAVPEIRPVTSPPPPLPPLRMPPDQPEASLLFAPTYMTPPEPYTPPALAEMPILLRTPPIPDKQPPVPGPPVAPDPRPTHAPRTPAGPTDVTRSRLRPAAESPPNPLVPSSPSAPVTPQPPVPSLRKLSRRTVVVGLVGVAVVGGATGTGLLVLSRTGQKTTPAPRSTAGPGTTVYFIYRGHPDFVNTLAWSPTGLRIASGSVDRTVQVWDAATGGNPFVYDKHTEIITAVAWSPNGSQIASGSKDATLQVWDAVNGTTSKTLKSFFLNVPVGVTAVAWSPDGQRLASGGDTPGGSLATGERDVHVWEVGTGSMTFTYSGHVRPVDAVAWSFDGTRIASGSDDTTVQIWDASDGGHVLPYHGHSEQVTSVAWSPDRQQIASCSLDKTVQVWQAATGTQVYTYHGHTAEVWALGWSPDGTRIASASSDGTVQVWDAVTGQHRFTYRGHRGPVQTVAWSPDGTKIASGGTDKSVQVWQAK